MTELHYLSATALNELYRAARLSPVDVVEALLARIDRLEPKVHAIINLDRAAVLAAAHTAAANFQAGKFGGPLQGIPVGIKDIVDVAGLPTTCSSAILQNNLAHNDATVVARLRSAGALIFGKLSTHEFALGGPSFDLPFPPARNPWNIEHHPGGSSSGSGVAVAAGYMPLAVGTDTAGSIRNPASACGICGLKPTYDLISRKGVFPLAFSLDHVGLMARSSKDLALVLDAIAAPNINGVRESYGRSIDQGVKGLRIGFVRHFHETDFQADPEVAAALENVAHVMEGEGAIIRDVTLPSLNYFAAIGRVILNAEAWSIHQEWLRQRPGDYAQSTRRRLFAGAFVTAADLLQAQRLRRHMIAAVEEALQSVDILMTVNAMDPACRIDDDAALAYSYPRQARSPFNVTGHPAISTMSGLSRTGLPLSVQFAAAYFGEETLLRTVNAFERITQFHLSHPPEIV